MAETAWKPIKDAPKGAFTDTFPTRILLREDGSTWVGDAFVGFWNGEEWECETPKCKVSTTFPSPTHFAFIPS